MISEGDIERVVAAARGLPPAASSYLEEDFVKAVRQASLGLAAAHEAGGHAALWTAR